MTINFHDYNEWAIKGGDCLSFKEQERQDAIVANKDAVAAIEFFAEFENADCATLLRVVEESNHPWRAVEFASMMTEEERAQFGTTTLERIVVEQGDAYAVELFVKFVKDCDPIALMRTALENRTNFFDETLSKIVGNIRKGFPEVLTDDVMRELETGVVL